MVFRVENVKPQKTHERGKMRRKEEGERRREKTVGRKRIVT